MTNLQEQQIPLVFTKKRQGFCCSNWTLITLDSLSTIRTVRIMDPRFKNIDGLNTLSTFGDINSKYQISSIQNTLRSLIISVDEINAYFTLSKTELPEEMRYNMNTKIEPISIPEAAKIKDFYLQWY